MGVQTELGHMAYLLSEITRLEPFAVTKEQHEHIRCLKKECKELMKKKICRQ